MLDVRDDAGREAGGAGQTGECAGVAGAVFAECSSVRRRFQPGRGIHAEQGEEFGGAEGGEFAGEGEGMDGADAAGGDPGLVLGGGGEEDGCAGGIEHRGDMGMEGQAAGDAAARPGGFHGGAEHGPGPRWTPSNWLMASTSGGAVSAGLDGDADMWRILLAQARAEEKSGGRAHQGGTHLQSSDPFNARVA